MVSAPLWGRPVSREAITHIAFYAGWPNAMSAITQLKNIVEGADAS